MRETLGALDGQRLVVRATVRQFSRRIGWAFVRVPTILLVDITTTDGAPLCDHVWLDLGKRMWGLQLKRGERIEFAATVAPYRRGMLRRPGEPLVFSVDYSLSYPTKVRRIAGMHEGGIQ